MADEVIPLAPARSLAHPQPASTRFHVGIDLAWADSPRTRANESGIVMLDPAGNVAAADWTVGVDNTVAWLDNHAPVDTLLFVDAPLVVNNETGQRLCEKQVGQRYWPWKVSANSTNCRSLRLAGVELLSRLEARGWSYHDGLGGPPAIPGRFVSECYPYTTIVGAHELGYADQRPQYKRKPPRMSTAEFIPLRNAECDKPHLSRGSSQGTRTRRWTSRRTAKRIDWLWSGPLPSGRTTSIARICSTRRFVPGLQRSGVDGERLVARSSDLTKRPPVAGGRPSSHRHARNSDTWRCAHNPLFRLLLSPVHSLLCAGPRRRNGSRLQTKRAATVRNERRVQDQDATGRGRDANPQHAENAGIPATRSTQFSAAKSTTPPS